MAAGIAPECPECCRRNTPYAVVSSRGLLQGRRVLPLCHTATTRSGLMSTSVWQRVFACGRRNHVCLPFSPTACGGLQHPREGAWCMQVRATVMVCDPV